MKKSLVERRRVRGRRCFVIEQLESRQLLAVVNFTNPAGGLWSVPSNWENSQLPTAADTVTINLPGNQTVTVDSSTAVVLGITSSEKLVITGNLNTSSINGGGTVELRGGTLRNATVAADTSLIGTGLGGILESSNMQGTLDLSKVAGASLRVRGGLNLAGDALLGDMANTVAGALFFGDASTSPGAITGSGKIIFGASGNNFIENSSHLVGAAGTLTFGAGITVEGKTGLIYSTNTNGSLLNQGTIKADVAGGTITIGAGLEAFTNANTMMVGQGSLTLNGTKTLIGLGNITRTGGTINLGGSLDLESANWNLNASLGTWNLRGGTVRNGTITESDGALLLPTGNTGVFRNISMVGNLDASRIPGANLRIYGGLNITGDVLLGDMANTVAGRLFFGDGSNSPGAITGSGKVIFGANGNNFIENSSSLAGAAGTLTIGAGITVEGKTGLIYSASTNGSLLNQGTIKADVAGGTITIGAGLEAFTNANTMIVGQGALTLNGTKTLIGLGNIVRTGGTINLGGSLDLESANWNLNGSLGTWNLLGGTVRNGTITESDGALLLPTNSTGVFRNISMVGNLDASRIPGANLRIYGGLNITGDVLLGDLANTVAGRLFFGDGSNSPGAITGSGKIKFGGSGSNFIENSSSLTGAAGTLTIGAGITVEGKTGLIYSASTNGSLLNQGTIKADVAGGTITIGAGLEPFTNANTIIVGQGALTLNGTKTLIGLGNIVRAGGTINLGGSLDLESANWNLNGSLGTWNLLGGTVRNGTITESDGALLLPTNSTGVFRNISMVGNLDASRIPGANLRIYGGLNITGDILLGDLANTVAGRLFFGDGSNSPGAITGSGKVIFGANGNNFIENSSSLAGAAGTLTIGAGITVEGKTGLIYSASTNGSLLNQGTIKADVAGGTITIGAGLEAFTNANTMIVGQGALTLNGTKTLIGLGNIVRTGGTINLGGSLDLESANWNLNGSLGTWNLLGGTVRNGTITESDGALLLPTNSTGVFRNISMVGNLDASRIPGANLRIYGGLNITGDILLGDLANTVAGRLFFGDGSNSPGAITGSGKIKFGGSGSNFIENSSSLTGAAGTLTIGAGITVEGKTGLIYSASTNGSLLNQGTIKADVAGGTITIGAGLEAFTNANTIIVGQGALTLNGTKTLIGLGNITRTGGTINLGGSLDLESANWNLNGSLGTWNLLGGTVRNGTITESDGALLLPTNSTGVFRNISMVGNLDASRIPGANLRIYGGLNITGDILLGDLANTVAGRLFFGDGSNSPGAITGSGKIIFGTSGSNFIENSSSLTGAAGTLTIGAGITVEGKTGLIYSASNNGSLINQGTINANVTGGTITIGTGAGLFASTGSIGTVTGVNLNINSSLLLDSQASLNLAAGSNLTMAGSLTSATTDTTKFRVAGLVQFTGGNASSPRLFEVMGKHLGPDLAGFQDQNFPMGKLQLAGGAYVKLIDQSNNFAGVEPEALYVNSVIVPTGSTIDLNNLHIVTRALQLGGTVLNGTITVIPDTGLLSPGVPTPGAISEPGQWDEWSLFNGPNSEVTIMVNNGGSGASAPVAPQVLWTRVTLLAPDGSTLATGFNTISGSTVTLLNVPTVVAGVYRVRIHGAPNNLGATGNYIVTALAPNHLPVMANQSVTVLEHSSASPGAMSASDVDFGQTLTYSIAGGNTGNVFSINATTGVVTINNPQLLDYELQPSFNLTVRATDNGIPAQFAEAQFTINLTNILELFGNVSIGDGTAQRSLVKQVAMTFDGPTTIDEGAFTVTKRGAPGIVTTQTALTTNGLGQTIVTLTFSGLYTRNGGVLTDGYYELLIDGTKIRRGTQLLDTNRDGIGGDTLVVGAAEADKFFALFGDTNGDAVVGVSEFGEFRAAFGKSQNDPAYRQLFDFDLDGQVSVADFGQFRNRFGKPKLAF